MTKPCIKFVLILAIAIYSCNPWTLDPITELICLQQSEYYFDSLNNEQLRREFQYDDNFNPVSEQYFQVVTNDSQFVKEIITEFDNSNNPTKIECFQNGALKYSSSKEWNGQEKIILDEVYDGNGELLQRTSYSYDHNNFLIERSTLIQPNYFTIERYENNNFGDPIQITTLDGNSVEILYIIKNYYNGQDQLIRADHLNSEEELVFYFLYEHNGQGDLTRLSKYNMDDVLQFEINHQKIYDVDGDLVDYTIYYNGHFSSRQVYEYDEYKNLDEVQYLSETGKIKSRIEYNFECADVVIH